MFYAREQIPHKTLRQWLHYDPLTGSLTWRVKPSKNRVSGSVAGSNTHYGYRQVCVAGVVYNMARLIWFYMTGSWPPPDKFVDHENRDRLDYRWSNLRLATPGQNNQNSIKPRSDSTTNLRGVSWNKYAKKFSASIRKDGKSKYLGYFDDPVKAHEAYLAAKATMHPFYSPTLPTP